MTSEPPAHFREGEDPRLRDVRATEREFMRDLANRRLEMFRMRMQVTLGKASAASVLVAQEGGATVGDLAWDFTPPPSWPDRQRGLLDRLHRASVAAREAGASRGEPDRFHRFASRVGRIGGAVRRDVAGLKVVSWQPSLDSVELVGVAEAFHIRTCGDRLFLRLLDPLPETLVASLPGRIIGDLIEGPSIFAAGYLVERVKVEAAGALVTMHAGTVPVSMPWAGRLDRLLADRRPREPSMDEDFCW